MNNRDTRRVDYRRVLFVRIGWMRFYGGPVPGDEKPIGGGRYNKAKIGHEVYNFQKTGVKLYGYFQPSMMSHMVALERIDREGMNAERLDNVLVVFVATRPEGKQVTVGWYRHATVFREQIARSPGKPPGFGHFCTAMEENCILLPEEKRVIEVPKGFGGMGQSNIWYPLEMNGKPKQAPWFQDALSFVDEYQVGNILAEPLIDAEKEISDAAERALARSKGQGFARSAKERRALEKHAMRAAEGYFRNEGFLVEDVSATRPYDLVCMRKSEELHVEVKGTTTDGGEIVLTNNEVKHVCNPDHSCALFILHSIRLDGQKVSGGELRVLLPWKIHNDHLKPVSYTYRVG
jgi:hypothetical protein